MFDCKASVCVCMKCAGRQNEHETGQKKETPGVLCCVSVQSTLQAGSWKSFHIDVPGERGDMSEPNRGGGGPIWPYLSSLLRAAILG